MNSQFDFAILGAGAIGSIIGAHLVRAGHSVVMLVRPRRAGQIQADGLRIRGISEFSVDVPTLSDFSQLRSAEVLIMAMKMPGSEQAFASLRHVETNAALSIQNSPLKDELLINVFGPHRVLGALADTSGEMLADGEVLFTRNNNLYVGPLAGGADLQANRIAAVLKAAGVRAAASANIKELEWSKFAAWIGLMAVSVTTREATWRYLSDPDSARVVARLIREIGGLVSRLGIELSDESVLPVASICRDTEQTAVDAINHIGRQYERSAPQHRMSSLQDLEARRSLEIHETLGYAIQKAAQVQLELPMTESYYRLIAAIDRMNKETRN
jgi:2-dehydropantoate 2-reductase